MKIDSNLVKKLRTAQNWSQMQLSEACGLSLRTIQRLENSGNASIESVRALAAAFGIDPNELILSESEPLRTPFNAVKTGLREFANFSGTMTRFEYMWFLLFVAGVTAVAIILHEKAYQIAGLILLLPFLSAGTRRLKDAGYTPWWQLLWLVPFGQVVVFYLLFQPSCEQSNTPVTKSLDAT